MLNKSSKPITVLSVLLTVMIISSVTYLHADRVRVPLFIEWTWSYGDPVTSRGTSRSDESKDEYSRAYAYTTVGEIIGKAADWHTRASVTCDPSDPHHQSEYSMNVSLLQSYPFILFLDDYSRSRSASSVEGDIYETESLYMFLAPLPDNMEEVSIDHCDAESEINGLQAKIPDYEYRNE